MRVVLPILLLLALPGVAGPLHADPPPQGDGPAETQARPFDFMPLVVGLRDDMRALARRPERDGPGGELSTAWKLNLKRRASRLVRYAKELTRSSLWEFDESGKAAVRLKPSSWGRAIRRMASLYTELGGAVRGYQKVVVSPERAIALWDRRHPPPVITGLTPAGVLLRRTRAEIAAYRLLKKVVPGWLLRELDRLIVRERIEIEARAEARRRWEAERTRAHAEIRARAEETRALVESQRALLAGHMASIRALAAALQEAEEHRLKGILETFDSSDPVHGAAAKHFEAMAEGRRDAEHFTGARTSRWGSILRQKWSVPRGKVLAEIKKAETRPASSEGSGG